jgi:DNA invertase Pin-like site-specific DNA recombinase
MKTAAKRVGIYVRVSTAAGQDTAMQESELVEYAHRRGWEVNVYRDRGQSGRKESRPSLDALLADVRKRRLDIVCVWSLDRLARNVRQLLELADEFNSLGVDLVSFKQNIDTSSSVGRLTYTVLSAVASFEVELLRERIRSGIAQARKDGTRLGRPPLRTLTPKEVRQLRRERREEGMTFRDLAKRHRVSVFTAHAICSGKRVLK